MTKQKSESSDPKPAQVDGTMGAQLLRLQVAKGRLLLGDRPIGADAYGKWELTTENYLRKAFGADSPNVRSVMDVGKYGFFPTGKGESYWEGERASDLTTQISNLEGLIEVLETEAQLSAKGSIASKATRHDGHKVFLVHGRNEAALQGVARFLERLGLETVVLREQPNQGRTIIEKVEEYSDVGFAVILLTPDDLGRGPDDGEDALHPRARQNVILELGFFIGRLGRNRVCALYVPGVEKPSDYDGVAYVEFDTNGAWRMSLAKELKAAEFPVDMNNAV